MGVEGFSMCGTLAKDPVGREGEGHGQKQEAFGETSL